MTTQTDFSLSAHFSPLSKQISFLGVLLVVALLTLSTQSAASQSGPASEIPTRVLDRYKIATGGSAWNCKATLHLEFSLVAFAMKGSGNDYVNFKGGQSRMDETLGPMTTAEGYDGSHLWEKDKSGNVRLELGKEDQILAVNDVYRVRALWWKTDRAGAAIAFSGERAINDGSFDVLTITPVGGRSFEAWFDQATGLLFRIIEMRGPELTTTNLSNYRNANGVLIPFRITIDRGHGPKYIEIRSITNAEFIGPLPDSFYAPPREKPVDVKMAGGVSRTEIPFQLINNHIYAPVRVNGRGPFLFLFDTGAGNGVGTSLCSTLGLEVVGTIPSFGSGAGLMEGGITRVSQMELGQAVLKDELFSALPLDQLEPSEGFPMQGLAGYEVFRRFVVEINYDESKIVLFDSGSFNPEEAGTGVRFVFHDHIPEVEGSFEGIPARFNLDMGSRSEITLTSSFVKQNALTAKHPRSVNGVFGWGIGGPIRGTITRGSEVTIGTVHVNNVVTDFSSENRGGFSGSIGGGLLKRFIVTLDYNHQIIYFRPRLHKIPDAGQFDKAGLWLNQSNDGFKILDVIAGSPAAFAGLRSGDEIEEVNGVAARHIALYELRKRLRDDASGTVVFFKVRHATTVVDVQIRLRDLI
jgi:hypothetical protein